MITFNYSSRYDPPAPVVRLTIRNPRTGKDTELFEALVDSGADATFIPIKYLRQLRMPIKGKGAVRSQWGESRLVNVYLVYLEIGGIVIQVSNAIGDTRSQDIVLGRDALNQLRLILNGWAEVVEIDE